MLKSFRIGGIHPSENKLSAGIPIANFEIPHQVIIPLSQHIGAPAAATVAKGDRVVVGQVIGRANGFVSSNIHSSVSGVVVSLEAVKDGGGIARPSVTIDVEGDEWDHSIDRSAEIKTECALTSKEIIEKIAEAGIVGMGGATFPTQVKLAIPQGKSADSLIINGVECEPFLTSDHRIMLEKGAELMVGVSLLKKALGVNKAYIGIENNKPDAIKHLTDLAAAYPEITIVPLKVQYPQGGEKQLIDAILKRQVPPGGLPIDVNVVVQNVGTAYAVYEAVQKNKPLFERVVTVTGKNLQTPANYLVRVGTPINMLIEKCGGDYAKIGKVVNGGPMMGRAMSNPDAAVTKGTSGILLMPTAEAARNAESECIKCAKCVSVCPMALEPYMMSRLAQLRRYADLEAYHITDCIECGSCSYTCPGNLPLVDYIRLGKSEVMKIIRSRK